MRSISSSKWTSSSSLLLRLRFAALDIIRSLLSVFVSRHGDGHVSVGLSCVEQFAKEWDAPAAARSSAAAFADLTWHTGAMNSNKVDHLPLSHMEAVAEFVVRLHG